MLLTNADLDHALGLLLLRQQPAPLVVYASEKTRAALAWLDRVAGRFCGIDWRTINDASLGERLRVRAIELPESSALQFYDPATGGTALIAPAVGEAKDELRAALETTEAVLFDGTFWSNEELRAIRPEAGDARAMHHLPVSDGSLELLRRSPARRKIYVHINNTNPILMPGSPERGAVERGGIEVGYDGLELEV